MKKILFAMLLAGAVGAYAAPLSPEAALEAALGEMPGFRARSTSAYELNSFRLVKTIDAGSAYIYRTDGGQFIIAAGDDSATFPLLGYGDTTNGETSVIPPAMEWLVKGLTSRPMRKAAENVSRESISPMVTTRWNQDEPYNNDCPTERRSKTMTGCEATAAAQILKYFEYPAQGVGTASYTWKPSYGTSQNLIFNYDENPFDWDNMLDVYQQGEYTEAQSNAVSLLMYGLGVGMKMQYGYISSGCFDVDGANCLATYFKYDQGVTLPMAEFYTVEEWTDLVYRQIAQQRPVLYTGSTVYNEGHAFVCDGYDGAEGDFFHINWGWGGDYDGYYRLTALDPEGQGIGGGSGAFTEANSIFKDLKPDEGGDKGILYYVLGEPLFNRDSMPRNKREFVQVDFNPGGAFGDFGGLYYFGVFDTPISFAMKYTDVETGEIEYTYIDSKETISYGMGVTSIPLTHTDFPFEGVYEMEIGFMNQGEWEKALGEPDLRHNLYVGCTDDNLYFSVDQIPVIPDGVNLTQEDTSEAPTEYYDLQGRKLTSPIKGIYLLKQGNSVRKVISKY